MLVYQDMAEPERASEGTTVATVAVAKQQGRIFYSRWVPVAIVRVFNDTLTTSSKPDRNRGFSSHRDAQMGAGECLKVDPKRDQF